MRAGAPHSASTKYREDGEETALRRGAKRKFGPEPVSAPHRHTGRGLKHRLGPEGSKQMHLEVKISNYSMRCAHGSIEDRSPGGTHIGNTHDEGGIGANTHTSLQAHTARPPGAPPPEQRAWQHARLKEEKELTAAMFKFLTETKQG